jgi:hypothetical protein
MLSYPKGPKLFCHENTMDLSRHRALVIFFFFDYLLSIYTPGFLNNVQTQTASIIDTL